MIVGLIGKKRSGKDSFAQTLVERGVKRFAFADPLKEAALHLDPLIEYPTWADWIEPKTEETADWYVDRLSTLVKEYGWEAAKEFPEVRRTLQNFGVAIRQIDEDFWLRTTLDKAKAAPLAVITDVRFPNEAEAIFTSGGVLVRIERPGLDSSDTHVSETALDNFIVPVTITNDGSLAQLASNANYFYDVWLS